MRTLKITGDGTHYGTKILDADTGQDIGRELGVHRFEFHVGDKKSFPKKRLVLELDCPLIIEVSPGSGDSVLP